MNEINYICHKLHWKLGEVISRCRKAEIVSRRKCISVALFDAGRSYREIGKMLNRDHNTIRYAIHGKMASREERKTIDQIKLLLV